VKHKTVSVQEIKWDCWCPYLGLPIINIQSKAVLAREYIEKSFRKHEMKVRERKIKDKGKESEHKDVRNTRRHKAGFEINSASA
jgi:hypothetical protein